MTGARSREGEELDRFYAAVAHADLAPLWTQEGLLPRTPPIADVPFAWSWSTVRSLAERAGELVPVDRGGDRRVLALANPGLGGRPFATSTLWAAVQYLGPGELAPPHRHSPAAVRFVLEGSGVWTAVDGDRIEMEPGDLVLTPAWRWHEHRSAGDGPMLWFDGLDLPMVRALDAVFAEPGPDGDEGAGADGAPVGPGRSASERAHGAAGLVEEGSEPSSPHSPLLAYRWADTDAFLGGALARSGGPYAAVRFTDPVRGGDALPTLRCSCHRVVPGTRTPTARRAGSSVWVAFEGRARAVVDGTSYRMGPGDLLAVPSWSAFDLEAEEPTTFFSISDAPVLEALHLARREVHDRHQPVTAEWGDDRTIDQMNLKS